MVSSKSLSRWLRHTRRRIEKQLELPWLLNAIARYAERCIRRWQTDIAWDIRGQDALAAHVADGRPVILVVWHGRLAMTPSMWREEWGQICSITSKAWPGRIVGQTLVRFGWQTAPMRDRRNNRATSLQVARMMKAGMSIGIACDGPTGPIHQMKTVPLDWARLTGAEIWLWSYSVNAPRHMSSWDRMVLPGQSRRGVMLYRKWTEQVPKRICPEQVETLRLRLEQDLNDLTQEADQAVGHPDILA